jgi:hypothetical protein
MHGSRLAAALALAAHASLAVAQDGPRPVPTNEWPDPNFFIQDANGVTPSIDDALTGVIPPIAVTGYTTGSRTVTVYTRSTRELVVGQYLSFALPCDRALTATLLQVQSVTPDRSFSVTLEYPSGVPSTSAACLAAPVQHGDVAGKGGGQITSNMMRFADGKSWPNFWISSRPAHTGLFRSGVHVLVVRKATAGEEFVYWNACDPRMRAGVKRAFGAAVYVANGAGASARAYINAGEVVLGDRTATAAARTWLSVHEDVPSGAKVYQEGVALFGPVGSTFVIGELESAPYPSTLPDGSFSTPRAQTILALASISPYVGLTLTFPSNGGFDVNMGQASNLTIAGGVSYMIGNLEGECASAPTFMSVSSPTAPTLFGPIVHQVIPGSYSFASGQWPLRGNQLHMYGTPGTTWEHVSWDIQGFLLLGGP